MSEARLLVTGDRYWEDVNMVRNVVRSMHPAVVIEGEAPGADTCAATVAEEAGIPVEPYPAYWSCLIYEENTGQPCRLPDGRHMATHGKPAGHIRNQRMLDEGQPTIVAAFHDDLENSKGTRDMVRRALKLGLPTRHYSHENPTGLVL